MRGNHRLAIVGWATDSGLGREFTDALRHLPVVAAFVLNNPDKPTRYEALQGTPHQLSHGRNLERQMERFIRRHKPTTILTWELPGSWAFPQIWKQKGIRWFHVVHWDWFAPVHLNLWRLAELIAPNALCKKGLAEMGLSSTLLPIPVDTCRFKFVRREQAKQFGSIYGYGGTGLRRGLPELIAAWQGLMEDSSRPSLVIRAQRTPEEVSSSELAGIRVEIGNPSNPAALFDGFDIAVQISRFEGVGLSLLEAQACGVPVITVDAEPMREIAPDLMISVQRTEQVSIMGKPITSHVASADSLLDRLRRLDRSNIADLSSAARIRIEKNYSWDVLKCKWLTALFGGFLGGCLPGIHQVK